MKHLLEFDKFRFFPQPVEQIHDIIETLCLKHYESYNNRKGKFANYNTTEHLKYEDIKDYITDDELFEEFPVEEIILNFGVNKLKGEGRQGYASAYYPFDMEEDFKSETIDSNSGLDLNQAIKIVLDIKMTMDFEAQSYDVEKFKEYIKFNIAHELTHAYQDYQQYILKDKENANIYNVMFNVFRTYDIKELTHVNAFYWLLYKLSGQELNADISAFSKTMLPDTIDEICTEAKNFNPTIVYKNIMWECKEFGIKNLDEEFGNKFVAIYRISCIEINKDPKELLPKVLTLAGKGLLDVLKFWYPYIKKQTEKLERKIKKI